MLTCLICNKDYSHLGSHIFHAHKITTRQYKEEFGLDYKTSLISPEVKLKKQLAFEEDREKYMANLAKGANYRFKKGQTNKKRMSEESKDRLRTQNEALNKLPHEICPICKVKFARLASHLYNKHGLLVAKR